MKPLYYFVLKNYRGIFKKKFVGNSHIFLIPRTEDDYLYLALLGNIVDEENTYACVLISRIPDDIIDSLIEGEHDHFGNRFELIEELNVRFSCEQIGIYDIELEGKSKYILSDLEITFNSKLSSSSKKIYIIKGKLNLNTEDVGLDSTLKIDAYKKLAVTSNKFRVKK